MKWRRRKKRKRKERKRRFVYEILKEIVFFRRQMRIKKVVDEVEEGEEKIGKNRI